MARFSVQAIWAWDLFSLPMITFVTPIADGSDWKRRVSFQSDFEKVPKV